MDQLLAREDVSSVTTAGEIQWPLADNQGSIRDWATKPGSTVVVSQHVQIDEYGRVLAAYNQSGQPVPLSSLDQFFAYTGRMYDAETGLQNNLNRWYDARLGRWLSEDPIGFAAGDANLYRYVGNNPTNAVDPSGLDRVIISRGEAWDIPDLAEPRQVIADNDRDASPPEQIWFWLTTAGRYIVPGKTPHSAMKDPDWRDEHFGRLDHEGRFCLNKKAKEYAPGSWNANTVFKMNALRQLMNLIIHNIVSELKFKSESMSNPGMLTQFVKGSRTYSIEDGLVGWFLKWPTYLGRYRPTKLERGKR